MTLQFNLSAAGGGLSGNDSGCILVHFYAAPSVRRSNVFWNIVQALTNFLAAAACWRTQHRGYFLSFFILQISLTFCPPGSALGHEQNNCIF